MYVVQNIKTKELVHKVYSYNLVDCDTTTKLSDAKIYQTKIGAEAMIKSLKFQNSEDFEIMEIYYTLVKPLK